MISIIRSAIGSLSTIGFLKFLKEHDFRVIGTDITDSAVGKFFVDAFYEVPRASEEKSVATRYREIVKKEHAQWIISGPEEEIAVLKQNEQYIETHVLHPPLETLRIITDKWRAFQYLAKNGFLMPQSYEGGEQEICPLQGKMILKPRRGRGSSGILVAENKEQLTHIQQAGLIHGEYIIQEFIEGEEWTVDTLHDLDGNLLNVVPRRRLKVDSGISIIGETVREEYLFELMMSISSLLNFVGGNCFQFIKDKSGRYYLTDINPRFGGGSILSLKASISFQQNLVRLFKGELRGSQPPSFDFDKLRMHRYYEEFYDKI